jgi:tRNA nucleotidyltransferase (CCA-adding enzyme)
MSDYMFQLDSHLDAGQNRAVAEIQRVATEAGTTVWLTGGAMRDMLRGAHIRDLDFTVERDALKVGRALVQLSGGTILAEDPLKRGVELELPGKVRASVSNARSEKYTKPGGKPQITPATIHEDLIRRDFTMNAIALSLNRGSRGLLVDPVNGQADLANRELRATNPYVFFDDPARIFRLIRFQHVLGFQVAARTQSQLENALIENYSASAPPAALAAEILSVAMDPHAVAVLEAFDGYGMLKLISPAWSGPRLNAAGLARFEKLANSVLPHGSRGGSLAFLYVLTEKLEPSERTQLMKAFPLSPDAAALAKQLPGHAKKLESVLRSPRMHRPSQVWEALEKAPTDEILLVLYESSARVVQDRIRAFYQKYLPLAEEVAAEHAAASAGVPATPKSGAPGTPKFEKARRAMIVARLNARPRKVPAPEPETAVVTPPPMAMAGRK